MKFKIGDKVRFLNEVGEGVVHSYIDDENVFVTTLDGFEFQFRVSELIPLNSAIKPEEITINKEFRDKIRSEERRSVKPSKKSGKEKNDTSIDLHAQELLDDFSGMSNGEILNIQLTSFRCELDKAIKEGKREITFVHGIGTGVLREEIRKIIDEEFAGLRYEDASYSQYGFGATLVIL